MVIEGFLLMQLESKYVKMVIPFSYQKSMDKSPYDVEDLNWSFSLTLLKKSML